MPSGSGGTGGSRCAVDPVVGLEVKEGRLPVALNRRAKLPRLSDVGVAFANSWLMVLPLR